MNAARRVAAAIVLLAAGFALGVAAVPSPTVQQRQALADVQRCTEALELTLHFASDAITQMEAHIADELGPLPSIDEMREDVARFHSTIAQTGGR